MEPAFFDASPSDHASGVVQPPIQRCAAIINQLASNRYYYTTCAEQERLRATAEYRQGRPDSASEADRLVQSRARYSTLIGHCCTGIEPACDEASSYLTPGLPFVTFRSMGRMERTDRSIRKLLCQ